MKSFFRLTNIVKKLCENHKNPMETVIAPLQEVVIIHLAVVLIVIRNTSVIVNQEKEKRIDDAALVDLVQDRAKDLEKIVINGIVAPVLMKVDPHRKNPNEIDDQDLDLHRQGNGKDAIKKAKLRSKVQMCHFFYTSQC